MREAILIVDDDQAIVQMLKEFLENWEYEVLVAQNASQALEQMDNNIVNAVLLDVKLPDMDGLELLKKIKEEDPDTTIMMISGFGTIEMATAAMKHGAVDFVQKPLSDFEDLRKKLKQALKGRNGHKLCNGELQKMVKAITTSMKKDISEQIHVRNEEQWGSFAKIVDEKNQGTITVVNARLGSFAEVFKSEINGLKGVMEGRFNLVEGKIQNGTKDYSELEAEVAGLRGNVAGVEALYTEQKGKWDGIEAGGCNHIKSILERLGGIQQDIGKISGARETNIWWVATVIAVGTAVSVAILSAILEKAALLDSALKLVGID